MNPGPAISTVAMAAAGHAATICSASARGFILRDFAKTIAAFDW